MPFSNLQFLIFEVVVDDLSAWNSMFSMTEKPSLMVELDASNSRGQAFSNKQGYMV